MRLQTAPSPQHDAPATPSTEPIVREIPPNVKVHSHSDSNRFLYTSIVSLYIYCTKYCDTRFSNSSCLLIFGLLFRPVLEKVSSRPSGGLENAKFTQFMICMNVFVPTWHAYLCFLLIGICSAESDAPSPPRHRHPGVDEADPRPTSDHPRCYQGPQCTKYEYNIIFIFYMKIPFSCQWGNQFANELCDSQTKFITLIFYWGNPYAFPMTYSSFMELLSIYINTSGNILY